MCIYVHTHNNMINLILVMLWINCMRGTFWVKRCWKCDVLYKTQHLFKLSWSHCSIGTEEGHAALFTCWAVSVSRWSGALGSHLWPCLCAPRSSRRRFLWPSGAPESLHPHEPSENLHTHTHVQYSVRHITESRASHVNQQILSTSITNMTLI